MIREVMSCDVTLERSLNLVETKSDPSPMLIAYRPLE